MSRVLIGNFKGPKGDKGDKGDIGPQGPQGPQGPVGLVNADAAIEFDDYSAEEVEIPTAEEVLAEIVSGKSLKSLLSNIKAFLMGGGSTAPEVIGDKFSETVDYVAGDYAIKDNVLYHFTADKAAGEWDETAVEPTTVTKELQDVNAKTPFSFGYTEDGQPGYIITREDGADTVTPFKGELSMVKIYSGNSSAARSVSLTSYEGYENFTLDNFFIKDCTLTFLTGSQLPASYNRILNSYNPTTGVLSLNRSCSSQTNPSNVWIGMYVTYSVYLITVKQQDKFMLSDVGQLLNIQPQHLPG